MSFKCILLVVVSVFDFVDSAVFVPYKAFDS